MAVKSKKQAEVLYKSEIPAKTWVPDSARRQARIEYQALTNNHRQYGEAYWQTAYNALEIFLTSVALKQFWKDTANKNVNGEIIIRKFTGVFFEYAFKPQFSEEQKNAKIRKSIAALKAVAADIESDRAVAEHFDMALHITVGDYYPLASGSHRQKDHFIRGLINNLSRNHAIKPTHHSYTRKFHVKTAESVFFMNEFSELIRTVYGRTNHRKTAAFLNVIRPDLGPFDESSVSKAVNKAKK